MFGYGYGYGYSDPSWTIWVALVLGLIITILLYALVFPKRNEGILHPFFIAVKNFFDLKYLLIEVIAKFVYVFSTFFVFLFGFFIQFYSFGYGLLIMLYAIIGQRILYEMFMLFILLVKNVIQINTKLKGDNKEPEPVEPPRPRVCPNCGAKIKAGSAFCVNCGTKIP